MEGKRKGKLEKEDLDSILRDLSREFTEEKLIKSVLGLTGYIMQEFSELGIDYLEIYQTLIKIPNSLYIIEEIYRGSDNPNKIINTYKLNPIDFYDFLREIEKLDLISYDGRKIKMTEKGKRLYNALIEVVKPLVDLVKILKKYYCERQEDKETKRIMLDLSDPAVRQWYEYLKQLEDEEKALGHLKKYK